ncbi:MAG: 4'-phosphopantetheinyl transferase family protein [Lachnospiraceae bacterium]
MEPKRWKGLEYCPGAINIWLLDLAELSEEKSAVYFSVLPPERRQKIERCSVQNKKKQSMGAGILLYKLCQMLQEKYGLSKEEVQMGSFTNGKPVFAKNTGASFSLSHTDDCVALAFILPAERQTDQNIYHIGVDVEQVKACRPAVAKRFFTAEEYDFIQNSSAGEKQDEIFFQIWTGKEAVIKKSGEGLRLPLNRFSVLEPKKESLQYIPFSRNGIKYAMTVCTDSVFKEQQPFISWVDCAIL